jgi:putative addiction module component (TIGR02574 family)
MADLVTELAERGKELPPEERVRLLDLLLESLQEQGESSADEAWSREIERRVASYEQGDAKLHDADHVIAEAVRLLR